MAPWHLLLLENQANIMDFLLEKENG